MRNARAGAGLVWMVGWGELALEALREVWSHKVRSLLTLFGIVFGAASVVSLTSLASALKDMAYAELTAMGMPATVGFSDRQPPSDATRAADLRYAGLTLSDVGALRERADLAGVYGHNYPRQLLVATPTDQRVVPVEGVDAGYLTFRRWRIVRGREIVPLDVRNASRVAVIGEELVEPFFGAADPIGRTLRIEGIPFTVVGVLAPFELELVPADFSFLARRIYVPFTYVTRAVTGARRVQNVFVQAREDVDFAATLAGTRAFLRDRHRGANDLEVENEAADLAEDLAMADGILAGWNVVLYSIAAITLVVGGIGLFSVLLIAVRERVREIGIRMALGADDRDIRRLFLSESVVLALLGALIGIGGGIGLILVTEAIARNFGKDFAIAISLPGTVMAIGFAAGVGLLFGWYPASRAARLNPVEAIREL
jgi:putative ABC transport system permease protein